MTPSRTALWATAAGAVLAIGISSLALSAGNPVEERQATMKHVGQTMKESAAFTSAATPFDAAKVKTLMDGLGADAKKLHGLYPAGSGADPKTAADPKVWENKADFDKRLAEMGTLAAAAGKATSAESFKPAFAAVGASCKSCHDIYRKKKAA
ncbi:MAG TPA: cytochrome c [Phenylobacterium sp.]|jgi:cytochrome c556|uniref:c-type cytochrome n=1 Tax=Phenylobacterium sp. TaxID=1871053 RepID=UPI002C559841|nr:cytochrome c [Phenylobacterium sp.]HXA38255.1 cytochrome c [Phenylobacterium sp.]